MSERWKNRNKEKVNAYNREYMRRKRAAEKAGCAWHFREIRAWRNLKTVVILGVRVKV